MRKWVVKALIQKFISFLPFAHRINFWFQKNITKGVTLSKEHFNDKLVHCSDHIEFYRVHLERNELKADSKDKSMKDSVVFELGTGWYPIVPIGFYLCGASKIVSYDVSALCTNERLFNTIDEFKIWKENGSLELYIPEIDERRWNTLINLDRSLEFEVLIAQLGFEFIVGDARKTLLTDDSIDVYVSNNVLEHIYASILSPILKELHRIVKSDGLQSHFIDMSDHFAHSDSSITVYNYLKYSKGAWKWIDNSVQPQNRMRLPQYLELFDPYQLDIRLERQRNGDLKKLNSVEIDASYNSFKKEEVAITHVHLLA